MQCSISDIPFIIVIEFAVLMNLDTEKKNFKTEKITTAARNDHLKYYSDLDFICSLPNLFYIYSIDGYDF
jgi:hypothetical protein